MKKTVNLNTKPKCTEKDNRNATKLNVSSNYKYDMLYCYRINVSWDYE